MSRKHEPKASIRLSNILRYDPEAKSKGTVQIQNQARKLKIWWQSAQSTKL